MEPIRNILAATDFSEAGRWALERAAIVRAELHADWTLVHVVEEDLLVALRDLLAPGRDLQSRMVEQGRMQLDAEAAALGASSGRRPRTEMREGRAVQELCEAARDSDLLVVGACAGHPVRDFTLGKNADHLARLSPVPLLVARAAPAGRYQHVLVPVDFSPGSRDALLAAIALGPQAAFHLMHCVDLPFEGRMRLAGASDQELAQHRAQARLDAESRLRALAESVREHGRIADTLICSGDVRFELTALVRKERFDLVALGKQGRSALGDKLLGSLAAWALEHAGCDVLVLPMQAVPATP